MLALALLLPSVTGTGGKTFLRQRVLSAAAEVRADARAGDAFAKFLQRTMLLSSFLRHARGNDSGANEPEPVALQTPDGQPGADAQAKTALGLVNAKRKALGKTVLTFQSVATAATTTA